MFTNIFNFFTFWVAILCIFHNYTHEYLDLVFLSFIVLIIGSYISFVHPKKYTFIIQDKEYIFYGLHRLLTIDLLHIMMFVLIMCKYQRPTKMTFINSLILIFIYYILFDVENVYKISRNTMMMIFILATFLYIILL